MILILSSLLGCTAEAPAPEPAPAPAEPAEPAPAEPAAPTVSERVEFELCGNKLAMDLYTARMTPRGERDFRIVPGKRVGPIRAGAALDVDAMIDYGWVGHVEGGHPEWYWFYTSSDLTGAQLVETYQPGFHCEGTGGDGQVDVDAEGRATSVVVLDARFRAEDPQVGVGSTLDEVRPWLCAEACEEEQMQVPQLLALRSPIGEGWFSSDKKLVRLIVPLGPPREGKAGKGGKTGKGGKKKAH